MTKESMYEVSDELRSRHPYDPEKPDNKRNFSRNAHIKEVARAFGARAVPKLAALLTLENIEEDKLIETLDILVHLLSTPPEAARAIGSGVVSSCAKLLAHANGSVRERTAVVISLLASSRSARQEFISVDVLPRLCDLLKDKSSQTRAASAAAINATTQFSDGCMACIDFVDDIVSAISRDESSPEVSFQLISAVTNISFHNYGVDALLASSAKIIDRITHALDVPRPGLDRECLQALWNLTQTLQGKKRSIKALHRVCTFVVSGQGQVLRCALGVLVGMLIDNEGKKLLSQESDDVIAKICASLDHKTRDTRVNAAQCVRLASEYPPAKKRFVQQLLANPELLVFVLGSSCAKEIVAQLNSEDAGSRKCAAECARILTESEEDGYSRTFVEVLHSIERLASVLDDETSSTVRCAESALYAACNKDRSAQRRLRRYLSARASLRVQSFVSESESLKAFVE